jgi:hypothetical protein
MPKNKKSHKEPEYRDFIITGPPFIKESKNKKSKDQVLKFKGKPTIIMPRKQEPEYRILTHKGKKELVRITDGNVIDPKGQETIRIRDYGTHVKQIARFTPTIGIPKIKRPRKHK